jgi:hypothetical protein
MPPAESAPPDWSRLYDGPNGEVWVHEKCKGEMRKDLDQRQRAHIEGSMADYFCTVERLEDVPSSRLVRDEGHRTLDGKKYHAQAFKNVEARVYGVVGSVNNKRAFFAGSAAEKKARKVDPGEVDRAIKRIHESAGRIPGAKI